MAAGRGDPGKADHDDDAAQEDAAHDAASGELSGGVVLDVLRSDIDRWIPFLALLALIDLIVSVEDETETELSFFLGFRIEGADSLKIKEMGESDAFESSTNEQTVSSFESVFDSSADILCFRRSFRNSESDFLACITVASLESGFLLSDNDLVSFFFFLRFSLSESLTASFGFFFLSFGFFGFIFAWSSLVFSSFFSSLHST